MAIPAVQKRWRRALCVALALGVAMVSSACSNDDDSDPSSGKSVTLKYLPHITPATTEDMYRDLMKKFTEEHPNIKVDLIVMPSTDDGSFLPRLLQSGNAPDVLFAVEPASLIKAGQLRPFDIDDEVKRIRDYEKTIAPDGKLYTLAAGTTGDGFMYYNKDAFTKAGITVPPSDLDELEDAMAKLKDAGYDPMSCGNTWMAAQYLFVYMLNELAQEYPDWITARNNGEFKFGDKDGPAARALERVQSWWDKGYFAKGCLADDYVQSSARFVNGEAAMYSQGGWYSGNVEVQESKVPIGVFLLPSSDGAARLATRSEMITHGVVSSTKHPEEADTLARWLTFSDEANSRIVGGENALSKLVDPPAPVVTNEVTKALGVEMAKILAEAEPVDDFIGPSSNPVPGGILDPATIAFEKIMGGSDPATELKALDDFWESQ